MQYLYYILVDKSEKLNELEFASLPGLDFAETFHKVAMQISKDASSVKEEVEYLTNYL